MAKIGIIGGSGFYSLFEDAKELKLSTKWGDPSSPITTGEIEGKEVSFLPRHGKTHGFAPHMLPYRANIDALSQSGVRRIISPCACGSLQADVAPGDFVIADQIIDRTKNRPDTFYDEGKTVHVSLADPYCPEMRKIAIESCEACGINYHPKGTVVVINGPRFSTRAESRWFSGNGWEVINMTQYPEAALARERDICFLNISLITDYDAGLEGNPEIKPVTASDVGKIFAENNEKLKTLLAEIVKNLPEEQSDACICSKATEQAGM